MIPQDRVPRLYLTLFASLYALQGVTVAYLVNYNKLYMIEAGVAPEAAATVQSLVLATLVFKFLLGPMSDRFSPFGLGHRRPYIILGLVLQSAGLVGLGLVNPGVHLIGYSLMAFASVGGMALFDTCCDGMVIDVTPPPDRSRVQGTLMVSRFLATMICSYAFGAWIKSTTLGPGKSDEVLWACAGLALPCLVLAILAREPRRAADAEDFRWSALGVMIRRHSLALLAFGALYGMIGWGVETNLPLYYKTLGLEDSIGSLASIRYLGRASGALLLPIAARQISQGVRLTLGILALAACSAGQAAGVGIGIGRRLGLRVRRGQRLERRPLLRAGDGGVGPPDGGLDVRPVHGHLEPVRYGRPLLRQVADRRRRQLPTRALRGGWAGRRPPRVRPVPVPRAEDDS